MRLLKYQLLRLISFFLVFARRKLYTSNLRSEKSLTIATLLCHRDVSMYICALDNFFLKLGFECQICVTNDGSLTKFDRFILTFLFPNIEIVEPKVSLVNYNNFFKNNSDLKKYRRKIKAHFMKIDAVINARTERVLLFDADLLFYQKPEEIVTWIENKSKSFLHTEHDLLFFSKGYYPEITIRSLFNKLLKTTVSVTFSSGLIAIDKSLINDSAKNKLNSFIQLFEKNFYTPASSEEYLFGLLCKINKSVLLAKDRYVAASFYEQYKSYILDKDKKKSVVMFHFGWEVKSLFFSNFVKSFWVKI